VASETFSEVMLPTYLDSDSADNVGSPGGADEESKSWALLEGGKSKKKAIRWAEGKKVEYRIVDAPTNKATGETVEAVEELDKYITTRKFDRKQGTNQVNPCTGEANTISWVTGDGPGGALAFAGVCYNDKTREIAGFRILFDVLDSWTTEPKKNPEAIDVRNVATHEMGHVAGLGDLDKKKSVKKDSCLTMFAFTHAGETQKRTLGWGDKLGLDFLYDTGDTSPGPGCGL
jgi:hypothetical protein